MRSEEVLECMFGGLAAFFIDWGCEILGTSFLGLSLSVKISLFHG